MAIPMKRLNWNLLGRNSPLVDLTSLGSSKLPPPTSLQVLPDFLSPTIGASLLSLTDTRLRRLAGRTYQQRHFDSVIHGYREGLVSDWTPFPRVVNSGHQSISQIGGSEAELLPRTLFETLIKDLDLHNQGHSWLAPHILDLENGSSGIGPHTDHPTALGSLIMGICLGSPCVMVYRRVGKPEEYFTVLLPPNCAYIMR